MIIVTWNGVLRCLQLVQPTMIPNQDRLHSLLLYKFEEPHRLAEINTIEIIEISLISSKTKLVFLDFQMFDELCLNSCTYFKPLHSVIL